MRTVRSRAMRTPAMKLPQPFASVAAPTFGIRILLIA
jgi:hypothetical protein